MNANQLRHAAAIADDAANYLTGEQVLPNDEGNAVAEGLTTLAMRLRQDAKQFESADEMLSTIKELVEWAGFMGGWESPVWDRAKSIAQQAAASATPESKPTTNIVVSCSGGCVTAVYCTDENATAEIIDFDEFEGGEGEEERDPDDALDAATEGMACVY